MVVGDHVCIAVFGFIHFQVGVLPGELLPRINGLWREREGGSQEGLQHSRTLQHTRISVRKSGFLCTPLPRTDAVSVGVPSSSVKPHQNPVPSGTCPRDLQAKQPLTIGQPAAEEPSPPFSLSAHPFLRSYPSAEIWSYARIPQRPDCAVLDLAVLLAVELQSAEIQQALGVLCPRSFE